MLPSDCSFPLLSLVTKTKQTNKQTNKPTDEVTNCLTDCLTHLDEHGLSLVPRLVAEQSADDEEEVGLEGRPQVPLELLEPHNAQVGLGIVAHAGEVRVHGRALESGGQLVARHHHHHLPVLPCETLVLKPTAPTATAAAAATTTTTTTTTTTIPAAAAAAASCGPPRLLTGCPGVPLVLAEPQVVQPRPVQSEAARQPQRPVRGSRGRRPQGQPRVLGNVAVPNGLMDK